MKKTGAKHKVYIPGKYVLDRMPIKRVDQDTLAIRFHSAMAMFTRGYGSREHWQTLADAVNVSLNLCEIQGLMPDALADVHAARDAMVSCRDRYKTIGKWGMTGDEMQAVKLAVTLYDEQNTRATLSQQMFALADVAVRKEMGDVR